MDGDGTKLPARCGLRHIAPSALVHPRVAAFNVGMWPKIGLTRQGLREEARYERGGAALKPNR